MTTATGKAPGKKGRARVELVCSECGWRTPKWVGRCGECGAWSCLVEQRNDPYRGSSTGLNLTCSSTPLPIGQVDPSTCAHRTTGIGELDRVLGGGWVPGAMVLLAGEPGVGKSTLLLAAAYQAAQTGTRVLYVTGEESAAQVRARAGRLQALHPQLYLAAETDVGALLAAVEQVQPGLLLVDSVQTMASYEAVGAAGGVSQVREVTAALTSYAKNRDLTTVLVGHVTKDGSVAGPRTLEHIVDVVLQFEGERHSWLRTLRASKNRFGPSDELGCFQLTDLGIEQVADPSGLFVSGHPEPVAGTCLTVALEGRRPLLVEVQALLARTSAPAPRRTTSGVDGARVEMVLAVLHRRAHINVGAADAYLATVGGARVTEPAADLALALAAASSVTDAVLPARLVAVGELGLAGEVRQVPGLQRRLMEASRLGMTRAVVPTGAHLAPIRGLHVAEVSTLREALAALQKTEG